MLDAMLLPQFNPVRAGRALATLLRDPDDLPQVFTLINSLSGTAPHRLLFAFRRSESGARLLHDQPDILPRLADRAGLRALPEGSLGREYVAFVESEGISPEGIRDASLQDPQEARPHAFTYVNQRMRDTHDLWHVVTGYKGDVLGELSLLAFSLAQLWNTGVALIVVAGLIKGRGRVETHMVREGYLRGRRATWLPALEWEGLLSLPLDEVRTSLGVGAPPVYTPIRTSELRAEGIV
jgi:ubiquinone biosynthesis protein COQ4